MVIDHTRAATPIWQVYYPGRAAFPIFAVLCGYLANQSRNPLNYCERILALAVFMQAFIYTFELPIHNLNLLFGLALGLWISQAKTLPEKTLGLIGAAFCAPFIEYGLAAIFVPVAAQTGGKSSALIIGTLCAWINSPLSEGLDWAGSAIAATAGAGSLWLLQTDPIKKPCPLPNTKALYAAYPLSFLPGLLAQKLFR